jgi:hypothetical protein
MSIIKNPLLFSEAYDIEKTILDDEGIFNPVLNVDTRLFIDPLLLSKSSYALFNTDAQNTYIDYFEKIIKLLQKSKKENDSAWTAAKKLLTIKEVQGTCLGYGVGSTNGRNMKQEIIDKMVINAKEIVDIGIDDPDLFALLPLIQDGIGPDFISDFTTKIIEDQLLIFSREFAKKYSIPLSLFTHEKGEIECIINPIHNIPVLLVPKDILAKLPTVSDWSGVRDAADFNESLRRRVNLYVANIWNKKAKQNKEKLKKELLSNEKSLNDLLAFLKKIRAKKYNFVKDEKGLVFWHEWLQKAAAEYPIRIAQPKNNLDGLKLVVKTIIQQYKFLIEKHGLNKLLWQGDKKAPEKVSQMLFFAISYSYCRSNDIDINPEMDAGSGLIDFKFSKGFSNRIIIELKLSSNQKLIPGYKKQLEIYKESEETNCGFYIVMNLGNATKKIKDLLTLENEDLSEIVVINSQKRVSASKL